MTNSLSDRIRARLEELGLNPRQASLMAGLRKDAVRDIITSRSANPGMRTLTALAPVLQWDVALLTGSVESNAPLGGNAEPDADIPIVGSVHAGVFTEMSGAEPWMSEEEFETIRAPRNPRYPSARCFAFRVIGDSMNSAIPRPILPGDLVLCVDVIDTELSVVDDKIYVIRRTKDSGQSYEWTLKRARVFTNRIELVPESNNNIHKTVTIFNDQEAEDGEEIAVVGLMYALYAPF